MFLAKSKSENLQTAQLQHHSGKGQVATYGLIKYDGAINLMSTDFLELFDRWRSG